jgi:hypothetical protein
MDVKNMKTKSMLWSAATLTVLLFLSGISNAQEVTGSIVGTVRDKNGAGVPNATVTITDPTKDNLVVRTVVTGDDGAFSAPNLPTTVLVVTVEAPNFKKSVNTDIKVDVGQRRAVDVILEAGRVEETVTITADQVSVELRHTDGRNGDQWCPGKGTFAQQSKLGAIDGDRSRCFERPIGSGLRRDDKP